ncbi:MAG: hypothetical protein UHM08_09315 [Bacteroidales bacterium]|nr:hypothetical protein [Bacteroidales bacterium]
MTKIEESEFNVRQARLDFASNSNYFTGALGIMFSQGIITKETLNLFEKTLRALDTESKKIESEYYKLRNLLEENK